jgi:PEP-CTERM motif
MASNLLKSICFYCGITIAKYFSTDRDTTIYPQLGSFMTFKKSFTFALVALALSGSSIIAKADSATFSLDETKNPTSFAAGAGVGQAVYATSSVDVNSFGFFLDQRGGGDVNFFVYDATTSSVVLAPDAVTAPSGPKDWTYLDGLTLALNAGDVYFFGVYGDGAMSIGLDPTTSFFSNGLVLPATGPTSFDFTGDTPTTALSGAKNDQGLSTTDVGLRVYDAPSVTPEPNSLVLLGTGILAAAGVVRRRLAV